jgi:hypothetical protein
MERNMEEESLCGLIKVLIQVNLEIIILKVSESMNGLMVEYSMVIGLIIKCKAMVHLLGLMDVNM